ncbi:MAG TPA: OmpA family protein [Saprospiraceae bacterium]|nr:OmpA family protein [Saprospiraceae bacterium]
MKKAYVLIMCMIFSLFIVPACNTSRATKGAVIGAGAGAAAGAILAKNNKAAAMIFGAAVGGVAGALIGDYMDKQAAKIREDLEGAKVERVGEGILITFDSGFLFDIDSDALKPATKDNLQKLSGTLKKYDDTDVNVLGHTDNTGTDKYNLGLSRRRASSVKTYLIDQDVAGSRLSTQGYGESDPIASNETAEGRQLNRRVEIVIVANEKLKKAAKRGDLPTG